MKSNDMRKSGANPGANLINTTSEVVIYALDDYFKNQKIHFIKADIESYEFDMLSGAQLIIKRDKPLLAVSIYHNASDIYTLPLYIKELDKKYKIMIRHHTYTVADTVMYAYI
jgi:hypothetical protein